MHHKSFVQIGSSVERISTIQPSLPNQYIELSRNLCYVQKFWDQLTYLYICIRDTTLTVIGIFVSFSYVIQEKITLPLISYIKYKGKRNFWFCDVICFPSVARFEKGDKSLKSFLCPKLNKKHELKDSQLRNNITEKTSPRNLTNDEPFRYLKKDSTARERKK